MALNRASFMSFLLMTLVANSSAQNFVITLLGGQQIKGYGPYGSSLQQNYNFQLAKDERISEVYVRHDWMVDAIGFLVTNSKGGARRIQFGGNGGSETRIILKENEYLTKISGKYGKDTARGIDAIGTLTIYTNLQPLGYGPFGLSLNIPGEKFDFQAPESPDPDSKIVGFFGRSGVLIESIGIFVSKVIKGPVETLVNQALGPVPGKP